MERLSKNVTDDCVFMGEKGFAKSLEYLYGLQRFGMVFGLSNITYITKALGNPQDHLKIIHIGGTNGKGSTAAMVASILRENGYRVGLYTSPHVQSFTERIQINGCPITEAEVALLTDRIRKRIEDAGIAQGFTFFDFTTAMAFLFFSESDVDFAVAEVGLGGRLDSTNVAKPLISVITNVTLEHCDILGKTLIEIAREKAGIVKQGVPVLTGATHPKVLRELKRICEEKGAPLHRIHRDFFGEKAGHGRFHFKGRRWNLPGLAVNLKGDHQITNATVAAATVEVLESLGFSIDRQSIQRGLANIQWPGRLEVIRERPQVVLDGAHNPAAARVLREALARDFSYSRCYLLLGIMKDKEIKEIVSILAPIAYEAVLCKPNQDRAISPDLLLQALEQSGGKGRIIQDVREGLKTLLSIAGDDDLICVTGSFYTVGEAREYLIAG